MADDIASGNLNLQISLNKPAKSKKAFICKTCSKYDRTIKAWSSIYDESSIGDYTDYIYSSSFSRGDIEDGVTISLARSGGGAVAALEKIQICKGTASAPDPTKRRSPIDCIDYENNPPECTKTSFETVLHHASGATPAWWMRFVLADNRYLKPTDNQDGWVKVGSGGGASRISAPDRIDLLTNGVWRFVTAWWNSNLPSDVDGARCFITTVMSAEEDSANTPDAQSWGPARTLSYFFIGPNYIQFAVPNYWNGTQQMDFQPNTDITYKVAVCATAGQNEGYYGFKSYIVSSQDFGTFQRMASNRDGTYLYLQGLGDAAGSPTSIVLLIIPSTTAITPTQSPKTWAQFSAAAAGFSKIIIDSCPTTIYNPGRASFPNIDYNHSWNFETTLPSADESYCICFALGIDGEGYGPWSTHIEPGQPPASSIPTPTLVWVTVDQSKLLSVYWPGLTTYRIQIRRYDGQTLALDFTTDNLVSPFYLSSIVAFPQSSYHARLQNADGQWGNWGGPLFGSSHL